MKKFKYLKVGIISALILALLCCASIAISGLFNKDKSDSIEQPEVSATSTAITTGSSALSAWNSAIDSSGDTITFNLTQDWNFASYHPTDGYLFIGRGKTVIFNGNGHTITGNGTWEEGLFDVEGTIIVSDLTMEGFKYAPVQVYGIDNENRLMNVNITNCSGISNVAMQISNRTRLTFNGGTISNCVGRDDIIHIYSDAYFNFECGDITNCTVSNTTSGGIIHVDSYNDSNKYQLLMGGGNISNNTGNGIYVANGEIDFYDGHIENNSGDGIRLVGEGWVYSVNGPTGGTISNNGGWGIRSEASRAMKLGSTTITGNKGGGVYCSSSPEICDGIRIYGNTQNGQAWNYDGRPLSFYANFFYSDALVYVHKVGQITSGYSTYHSGNEGLNYFRADNSTDTVSVKNGEIYVDFSYEARWNALVTANNGITNSTFTLEDGYNWEADANGRFGSGVGFTDSGSIYVPSGKTMTIDLVNMSIVGSGLGQAIVVDGALSLYGVNGEITNCGGLALGVVEVYGTLDMYGGYIKENSAAGVFLKGTFNLSGGYIENNICGVEVDTGNYTFTMTSGYIRNNRADGVSVSGVFNMNGGTISGNSGDGVDVVSGGGFKMESGTISGNTGNGIYSSGTVTMTGGSITGNTGNGVALKNTSFTMSGGTISGNATGISEVHDSSRAKYTITISEKAQITNNKQYGIIIGNENDTVNIAGGTISGNPIGVQIVNGTFTMSAGEIKSNTQVGVALESNATGTLTGGTISSNPTGVNVYGTFDMNGGVIGLSSEDGVYVAWDATFNLHDGNVGKENAGNLCGVKVEGGTFNMDGGSVAKNTSSGVTVVSGTFALSGGTISDNPIGVQVSSTFEMTGGKIEDNTSFGVEVLSDGTFTLTDGSVASNSCGVQVTEGTFNMNGGLIVNQEYEGVNLSGTFNFTNGTIVGNSDGVVVMAGTFTMSGTAFIDQHSGNGVDVGNGGTFNMEGGTITGCASGINVSGTATMTGGEIYENTNGAYVNEGGLFEMSAGTIYNNTIYGVNAADGEFTMTGGTIYDNAQQGVNIYSGTFTMSDTALVEGNGGGVYIASGVFNMDGGAIGTVDGGNTNTNGAGVYVYSGEFKMTAGSIVGNTATGNGGGVYVATGGKITVTGGVISDNHAANGAGIYVSGSSANPVSISNTRIENNIASTSGGGLYVYSGTPTVTLNEVTVSGNKANGGNGGGIGISNGGTFTMTNCVVDGNTATGSGAGVYLASSCTAEIKGNGTEITGNTASNGSGTTSNGGGIASSGCDLTVTGITVSGNTATGNGGGIYLTGGKLNISGATVSGNGAKNGAGLYVMGATAEAEIESVTFTGNEATTDGGAIYVASGEVTVKSATVGGATASLANSAQNGGGLFVANGTVDFQTGTVSGNSASGNGGGIYLAGGSLAIGTVTVSGNTGSGIYVAGGTISMSGAPKIQNNFDNLSAKSNLVLPEDKKIELTGPFEAGAIVYVTSSKAITTGYTTHNGGTLPKVYFYSDDPAGSIVLKDGEAYFAGSLADLWNDAVERSTSEAPVEFELTADWVAVNNSFGEGIGFQNGSLYIPEGKSIILTSNGHKIEGCNANGETIAVGGKLVIKKGADITIKGTSEAEGAATSHSVIYIENDGIFEMNAGYIVGYNTGINVEEGGTLTMAGGEITGCTEAGEKSGIYIDGGTATITGGQIYDNTRGVLITGESSLTISGGEIYGGTYGVYIVNGFDGTVEIKEDAKIFDNNAGIGIGTGTSGTLTVSGGEIYGNSFGIRLLGGVSVTISGGRIYDNSNYGVRGNSNGSLTISGGAITGNKDGVAGSCIITMTGGEIFENEGRGVVSDGTFKFSGGKIYSNGEYGVEDYGNGEYTGGEIYGNNLGGIEVLGNKINVSGSIRVYDNVDANGNPNNIHLNSAGYINVNGALTATAQIHVNFNGVITTGFSNYTHGAAYDEIFLPDILGSDVTLENGEVKMTINYASMWNKAVQKSLDEQTQVTFTLYSNWISESNGSFGTGDGFENGALKVPVGANIVFNLNNYALVINNTTSGGNLTVFKVYGTLDINDKSSKGGGVITRDGNKSGMQAANVAQGGTLRLTRFSSISGFDATYSIESRGNLYIAGGTLANQNTSVYQNGGKFEMTGGTLSGNNAGKVGLHLDGVTDATISGGSIYAYSEQGVLLTNGSVLTMDGGNIRNNKYGIELDENSHATFTMNGGSIYSNTYYGIRASIEESRYSTIVINEGSIYSNGSSSVNGINIGTDTTTTLTINGGKIYNPTGTTPKNIVSYGKFYLNGGEIYGGNYGVESYTGGEISGGSIHDVTNEGIRIVAGSFVMSGGSIYGNKWGVYLPSNGTLTMTGGEIYSNETGVYAEVGTFTMSGGEITSNNIGVDTTPGSNGNIGKIVVSGAAQIYDNLDCNVKLASGKVITVNGTLTEAHIGVTTAASNLSSQVNFTSGYGLYNEGMAPATFFFSDDSSYSVVGVGSGTNQEAKLGTKVNQSAIVWRYTAKEGGSVIESNVTIDGLYMGLDYEEGVTYVIEAINGATGTAISFIVNGNETVTSLTVDGIGKYVLTVNNSASQYTNTVCTFEILRVTLDWEYRIEGEGANQWKTVDFDSFEYTGRTYQFRAMLDGEVVQQFIGVDDAACDAGVYTYTTDETKYVNYELTITILTRKVEVVWNYNNATLGRDGVYYWTYDGINHAPVASLKNIGGDLAGVINLNLSYSNGTALGAYAPINAGTYTVTVNISGSYDGNIEISNTEATFVIRQVGLGVQWRNENGTVDSEFTFDYDGKAHKLTAVLDGLLAGEISPVKIIYKQGETVVEAPVNAGLYTAYAVIEGESNYVLREAYSCQIVIEAGDIEINFKGNEEAGGVYEWTFNGRGRTPTISVVSAATGGEISNFTVEYATADNTGSAIGSYTSTTPINAGMYVVRVTVTDTEGNVLAQSSQAYEIKQLEVTVTWTGVGGEEVDGVIRFEYDGTTHTVVPSVAVNVVDEYGYTVTSLAVVCTGNGSLTDSGSAIATAALKDTAYNKNFRIISGSTQKFEVYKKVITSYGWQDDFGGSFGADGKPDYSHGTVTGELGPNLTVTVEGLTLEFSYTYSASFEGVWAADVVNGYTVTATLTAEYAKNYEFEGGEVSVELTFTITATAGNKVNVNVIWVIFTDDEHYVTYEEYLLNNSIIYNGKVQYPTPVYINNGTYEVLSVNPNTVGKDAGDYTATLLPSNLYNYVSGFECPYTIAPLGVEVVWQHSATDDSNDFEYTYNGKVQAPYAYATVDGKVIVATVEGNVNANTYFAVADFGKNYTVTNTDEAEKEYTIKQLEISADDVVWSFANADGTDEDGVYYTFDGAAHAPEASVTYTDGDGNAVTVKMAVTGATEAAGTHTAYAVFDGGNEEHTNFCLVGTASTEYRIVGVESVEVIWEFEGAEGNENDGYYWIYDGEEHVPTAYLKAADGTKGEKLNVSAGNTEAGEYVAYVTSDMSFGGTLPSHAYAIKAKALNVEWSDTTAQYDGTAHKPTATVEDGIDGALELGVDYTVTEFTNAGKHTAEIIFLNNNYTFAEGTGSVEFVIEKITLKAELVWSVPEDSKATANENGVYSWQYDGTEHAPELTFKATYMLGDEEVVFGEFTYAGLSALVGTHSVTATLGTATWNGEDVSNNFALDADIRTATYEITHYVITIVWSADDKDGEEDDIPFWYFDNAAHGPTATYIDWNGDTVTLEYAKETNVNANAYTATVILPANCVLAEGSSLTVKYLIKQAEVSVIWEWVGADGVDADGNPYWTYDGKTEYGPKAYLKEADGTKGAELTVHGKEIGAGTYSAYVDANNGNYVITDGTDTQLYTINKMNVFVKWTGNAANGGKFEWTYKEGVSYAPTAQLVDANGNVILGSDKKPVQVTVTGAMIEVGNYTATAVDGFEDYTIVEDATHKAQQEFEIVAASLKDKNFRWDGGDAKVNGLTFTYTYNGNAQAPAVRVNGGITVELTVTDAQGNEVPAIIDAGTYKITAKSMDKNYIVPDDLKEITVVIAKAKVEVKWSDEPLVYNGSEQAPTAYFVNAQNTEVSLTVKGAQVNAGKGYIATAEFTTDDGNYELSKNVTKKFDIGQKNIAVEWTWGDEWTNGATDYDGNAHMPVATVSADDVAFDELKNISVYYTVERDGKLLDGENLEISQAGEYKITYHFRGTSASNYMMSEGTVTFTINKVKLTITLDSDTVDYGAPVPAYGYHFTGFVTGEDETTYNLTDADKLSKWLRCRYNETSVPGTYDILIDEVALLDFLKGNYEIEWEKATLTVNAPEKTLIWQWPGATSAEDVIYNGEDRTPTAYYKEDGTTHGLEVTVYTKADYDAGNLENPVTEAINAGDYVAVATYEGGVYTFDLVKPFTIKTRTITVVIHDQSLTYGEVEADYSALLKETLGWDYDGTLPVTGDELEIVLALSGATLTGNLVNAGEYDVTGSYTPNANYTVTFIGEKGGNNGLLKIAKAEIKVDAAENGVNEVVTLAKNGNGKAIDLFTNPLNHIHFTGNDPAYKVEFSKAYGEGEEAPDPADETGYYTPSGSQRPVIYETGKWIINYRITETGLSPNHEVKLGQWIIEAVYEDEVITVKFVKPYTLTYGEVIPADLAKALIDSGSIEVTPSAAVFLENVVATAVDSSGEPLSGKLSVGRYQINFSVKDRAFSQIVVEGETENVGIIVNKAALKVEWGEVEFDYDETTHTPEISVVIGGEKVKLNLGTNTVNIGGEEVTLVVAVDGGAEIKEAGAYSVLVTVLSDNFEIAEADAHRAVTVKSALLPPVGETPVTPDTPVVETKSGVPDWLLWVIIAALIVAFILIFILIVVVKRRPAGDADGFYEDADVEND